MAAEVEVLHDRRILLIISGGIAAYKSLDLIRRLRERGAAVRAIMTAAAQHFVTPLSVASLCEDKVYTDLWSLTDESEMGHIRLSREADLVVVAPASADLIARMAAGLADDLGDDGIARLGQAGADRADDEFDDVGASGDPGQSGDPGGARGGARRAGLRRTCLRRGRLGADGRAAGDRRRDRGECSRSDARLAGRRALVTSGPTREPIDPVRYISNHSSGKQGHAIAAALARARRRDGAGFGPDAGAGAGRGSSWSRSRPRRRCWPRARRRCRSMSR